MPSRIDLGTGVRERIELRVKEGAIHYRWIYWSKQQFALHALASAMACVAASESLPALLALVNLVIFTLSLALAQASWARVLAGFEKKLGRPAPS
jgi:hypothetical protein